MSVVIIGIVLIAATLAIVVYSILRKGKVMGAENAAQMYMPTDIHVIFLTPEPAMEQNVNMAID